MQYKISHGLILLVSLVVLPSSSVDSGSLHDYVEWHISWDPNNKAQYLSALNILQSKYYDLQIIQGWKSSVNEYK